MPRYFLNTNAQRPFVAVGHEFKFDLVGQRGGSWLGVLAVEDDSIASILAGACPGSSVEEISAEKYESEKKKAGGSSIATLPSLLQPRPAPSLAVADPVGPATGRLPGFENNGGPNSTSGLGPVNLLSTNRSPPREVIIDGGGRRRPGG